MVKIPTTAINWIEIWQPPEKKYVLHPPTWYFFLEKPPMKLVRKNRNLNEYERLSNITLRSEGTALLLLFTEWMHIYIGIQGVFFYV